MKTEKKQHGKNVTGTVQFFCLAAVKKLLQKKKGKLLNDKGGKGAAGALYISGHPRVLR